MTRGHLPKQGTLHRLLPGLVLLLAACGREANPLAGAGWRLVALGDAGAPAVAAD